MRQNQRPVFALEHPHRPVLAFEAENVDAADRLAKAPWFVQSLTLHYKGKLSEQNDDLSWNVRAATDSEAMVYRSRLSEFAEEANRLLVVPVNVP